MKKIFYILFFVAIYTNAQDKYLTKTGTIHFEASVPSFEEVTAKNEGVTAIINTENGELASLALVKGFRFKNALMEEHFNENYAESSEFPKALFKGKILNFSLDNLEGQQIINGELTFHGVSKSIEKIPVTIETQDGVIILTGNFTVLASDYNIKIPKVVKSKVSQQIKIRFKFDLVKK